MSWFLWFKHKKPKIGWTFSFENRNMGMFFSYTKKKIKKKEMKVNCKRNFPYTKTAICFCLNIINTVPQNLEVFNYLTLK